MVSHVGTSSGEGDIGQGCPRKGGAGMRVFKCDPLVGIVIWVSGKESTNWGSAKEVPSGDPHAGSLGGSTEGSPWWVDELVPSRGAPDGFP
jgi:hypothetical protein